MEISLAGNMGVSVEASNGSVPGDSNYNVALSNDTLVLPPMDPYGPATRYIDMYVYFETPFFPFKHEVLRHVSGQNEYMRHVLG